MGVPKFFRWISERYPLTSCLITESNVPEFDNLYLDMNGIIHNASHPSSDDGQVSVARPEHIVFREIFAYVELLFSKIRPKKLFFLAVDGVAPRAKLNQQRSRRFRTAKEAADAASKHPRPVGDADELFDSNCITPGTKFMHNLQSHLRYFVAVKKTKDPQWRAVKIILSGPACPGEGEHKIMEYIRHCKCRPDYDPNTRHCLYGLDADLIMLGLLSHAPHFALLREEVVFGGRNQKRKSTVDRVNEGKTAGTAGKLQSTRFYLMHLGLLRDYLEEEFVHLTKQALDVERVIDDIILMAMLVGNDFLPHLPNLHVGSNALGLLFDAYKAILPELSGHLHEHGRVHFGRVARLLKQLSLFELEMMEKEWANRLPSIRNTLPHHALSETQRRVFNATRDRVLRGEGRLEVDSTDPSLRAFMATLAGDFNLELTVDPAKQTVILTRPVDSDSDSGVDSEAQQAVHRVIKKYDRMRTVPDADCSDQQQRESELLAEWKAAYYAAKVGGGVGAAQLGREFAVGMQWVVSYYYEGVASWSWFYPYHYGPHISDLAEEMLKLDGANIRFDLAVPLRPLEQLMAVLPLASARLLPNCLSELMRGDLEDMYPTTFKQDMNGKKNSWEAIVLIPFLDEGRLLSAVHNRYKLLTTFETRLNEFGPALSFDYISNSSCKLDSPCTDHFPTITDCPIRITDFSFADGPHNPRLGFWNKCAKAADRNVGGFPTLSSALVPHHPSLEPVGVTVFSKQISPHPSLLLCVTGSVGRKRHLLEPDSVVLVDWPFLREAVVVEPFTDTKSVIDSVKRRLLVGKAIRVPDNDTIVGVRRLVQSSFDMNSGAMAKRFEDAIHYCPQSLIVSDAAFVQPYLELLARSSRQSLDKLFPTHSKVVLVGEPHFGALASVVAVEGECIRICVPPSPSSPALPPSIDLPGFVKKQYQQLDFQSLHSVAKSMQLHPLLVSKMCSSFMVYDDLDVQASGPHSSKPQSHDIGLRIKYESRGLYQLDACRRIGDSQIGLSRDARKLLSDYREAFPELFQKLASVLKDSKVFVSLFSPSPNTNIKTTPPTSIDKQTCRAYMARVKNWLKARQVGSRPLVGEGSVLCTKDMCNHVEATVNVEETVNVNVEKTVNVNVEETVNVNVEETVKRPQSGGAPSTMLVPPSAVLTVDSPGRPSSSSSQSPSRPPHLGDRVRYCGRLYSFGALGTIVGVLLDETKAPRTAEVLLDEPLIGLASDLDGRCSAGRGIVVDVADLLNLNAAAGGAPRKVSLGSLFQPPATTAPSAPAPTPIPAAKKKQQSITQLLRQAALSDTAFYRPREGGELKPAPQFPRSSNK